MHGIMVWIWNLTSGTAWPQNFPRLRPRFEVSTSKSCPSLFDFSGCIARFPDWSPKREFSANYVTSYLKKKKKTVQKISFKGYLSGVVKRTNSGLGITGQKITGQSSSDWLKITSSRTLNPNSGDLGRFCTMKIGGKWSDELILPEPIFFLIWYNTKVLLNLYQIKTSTI